MKCDRNTPGFALSLLTIAVTLAILLIGTKLSIPTIILLLIDILLLMALCVFYLHIPYSISFKPFIQANALAQKLERFF